MRCNTFGLFSVVILGALFCCITSQAATVSFILDGTDGLGLLPGNENPPVTGTGSNDPGEGGLGSGGISFDTGTNILSIDVEWGTGNPGTRLTGDATAMHIHLPTANSAPTGFGENVGDVIDLHTLGGFNSSSQDGGLVDTVTLSDSEEVALLSNKAYINAHTTINTGGEIRGHLVADSPIPEPATIILSGLGFFGLFGYGRRRRH